MVNIIPTKDILELLFATVATIVATVTGLIGAFSTFRLQNINREVNLLKDMVIHKKSPDGKAMMDFIKEIDYSLLEKIYDRNPTAASLLKKVVADHCSALNADELLIDIDNITRNQQLHDDIKKLIIAGFRTSLIFVFLSLLLLLSTNILLSLSDFLWLVMSVYLMLTGYVLLLLVSQLKKLID